MLVGSFFVIFILDGFASAQNSPTSVEPIIKIPQGMIQGTYKQSYRNRTYSAFEGIPYAQPPLGNLRFREPIPASSWSGTLRANRHYECLHFLPFAIAYGPRGNEDCLYLYVYAPRETIDPNELLDVIVHIHGGAFMMGSPQLMAGPQFLMDRDVIVVTLNYRLGILGFLSTEDNVVPGNNGLKDQSLALEWIKSNIKYFGGNPASITITGLSAGAASVHFHYFSPLSKGLFHRGFSQSGTALQCWSLAENSLEKARKVARNLTCPTASTEEMIDCLRKVEAKALINGIKTVFVYMDAIPVVPFGPVVEKQSDTAFITEHPYKLLQEGNVYDVPWITSNTKDEGLFAVGLISAHKKFQEFEEKWFDIMQYALEIHYTVHSTEHKDVLTKIKEFYFKDKPIAADNIFSFADMISDRMFLVDAEKAVRLQAQATKSEVYYYLYSYLINMPHFPPSMPKGAIHGDDGRLLFKMIMTPRTLSEKDEEMMEIFVDFITSYAKKGVPKVKSVVEWLPVKPGEPRIDYLQISDPDNIAMKTLDHLGPSDFWNSLPIRENDNVSTGSSTRTQARYLTILTLTIPSIFITLML